MLVSLRPQSSCVSPPQLPALRQRDARRTVSTVVKLTTSNFPVKHKFSATQNAFTFSRQRHKQFSRHAKFQDFGPKKEGEMEGGEVEPLNGAVADVSGEKEEPAAKRDDEVMPENLDGAIRDAARAAALFCSTGGTRALVELLLPDLQNLSEEGAQQQLWNCSRKFMDHLRADMGFVNIRAVFPDAGAAALLRHQWPDAEFSFSSLNDRKPLGEEEEVVVLIAPDYQLLETVERIANTLAVEDGLTRPLVMWNPRLFSGDVGVGLNVRRLRENFMRSFTTVYSIRPVATGAIFRCYPGPWQIFLDDPQEPGRYILMRQQGRKPDADDIEEMYLEPSEGESNESEGPSSVDQVMSVLGSLSRFMKSLSR